MDKVTEKWQATRGRCPNTAYSIDRWHGQITLLRQFLKGCGNNLRRDFRIREIDDLENLGFSCPEHDLEGYQLELELEEPLQEHELYWQQRGGEKWILEGDNNTNFCHLTANGRRRKKSILSLENEGENITDPKLIKDAIYEFYKKLFGKQPKNFGKQPTNPLFLNDALLLSS